MPVRSRRLLLPLSAALAVVAGAGLLAAGPAAAGDPGGDDNDDGNRVVLTGRVDVGAGDTVENVVIFNGPAVIDGRVKNNVVAFNGNIRVSGQVDDNVVAINGRVILLAGANVSGDVRSSDRPVVDRNAQVGGEIEDTDFTNAFGAVGFALYVGWWLALSISLFVLGVLFLWLAPRAAEAAIAVARTRVGPSIGWGFAMTIGLPIVSIIVLVTLVGAPLGLVGLFTLVPLFALGYVTSAYLLGRLILRESNRFLAFLVGWGILRLIELLPVLGHLVSFAAVVFGVGALTVAAWRGAHGPRARAEPAEPATAPAS